MRARGLSLIEVLVVIAVVGILVAIALPAIQMARESARKSSCANHMRQIGIALHAYQSTHRVFPPHMLVGAPGGPWNEKVLLLQQLGAHELYNSINFGSRWMADANTTVARMSPNYFLCPSDAPVPRGGAHGRGASNYKACMGSGIYPPGADVEIPPSARGANGLFATSRGFAPSDVRDGLSNTAAISEMVHGADLVFDERWPSLRIPTMGLIYGFTIAPPTQKELMEACESLAARGIRDIIPSDAGAPWCADLAYNHLFTPGKASCTFDRINSNFCPITASSRHPNGVNVLFADGHVATFGENVDTQLWRAIGSKDGDEPSHKY